MTSAAPILLKDGIEKIRAGDMKPSEWAAACCERIERYDGTLKAFSYFNREQVMSNARALDGTDWRTLKPDPVLAGAPLGVKDIFNTADHPNSMGSSARAGYWPGNDARVVAWAKLLGAQVIGKTTTAEFAVHTPPDTINPWDAGVIAGTSSTGSAVAVATGMVPAALGTQSAGSIARPSSYNGVVGFKPSFGTVPRTGVLKTCDTFDTIGWMTRSVADAALLFSALRMKGDNYPAVERGIAANIARYAGQKKMTLGLLKAPGFENIVPDSWDKLTELCHQVANRPDVDVVDADLRDRLTGVHATHATIYDKSLAYYFKRELKQIDFISPIFKEIVARAEQITPESYFDALDEQEKLTRTMASSFDACDFYILPATAGEAVPVDSSEPADSSLIWTLTGCPSLTLPLLKGKKGLPVGVTIVGPKYSDMQLLEFARTALMPGAAEIVTPAQSVPARKSA